MPEASALDRAMVSLEGLAVGDCFGQRYFGDNREALGRIQRRELSPPPWPYTDDTEMALSIVEILREHGRIDQDALAASFARRMDPQRGYGQGTSGILTYVRQGLPWRPLSYSGMGGVGSFGNGAAMRVAPLGAYFATDLERTVDEARLSAEVTHAHAEGIAGAIAVAVAAAILWRERKESLESSAFLREVLGRVPRGFTHDGIAEALALPADCSLARAAGTLGNGAGITAPDTVPLCLWVASRGRSFEESLWTTVAALGDRDTTCAIVGGMVVLRTGVEAIPAAWRSAREVLPR